MQRSRRLNIVIVVDRIVDFSIRHVVTDLRADVLKVAHHGSRTSSSGVFLAAVDPAVAVISLGAENRFGHPHPTTLEALAAHVSEDRLYSTDLGGTIGMSTDDHRLWVVAPER